MQQQQRPPRLHHTPRSYTKLVTTPPPRHTPPTALAIKRAPCGHTPRGTDGDAAWRRRGFPPERLHGPLLRRLSIGLFFRSAARCPAETPVWITPTNPTHLPVSEARSGRGRAGVSSPDWRTRLQCAQKRAGRSVERTCGESARRVLWWT